jgi:hypothetical protein
MNWMKHYLIYLAKCLCQSRFKKAVLAYRGTGMEALGSDWINNLIFLVSDPGYKLTPRYQTALKCIHQQ